MEEQPEYGPPPPCLFCTDRPSGSQEHAWPNWVLNHLLAKDTIYEHNPADEHGPLPVERFYGDDYALITTCVCGTCNGNWMRRLEDVTSRFLKGMIDGERTMLTPNQQRVLACWAVKTATMLQSVHTDTWQEALEPIDKKNLIHRRLPRSADVYLAHYRGYLTLDHTCIHFRVVTTTDHVDEEHSVFVTCLLMGEVMMQVLTEPGRYYKRTLNPFFSESLIPLVSAQGQPVQWPPRITQNDHDWSVARRGPTPQLRVKPF